MVSVWSVLAGVAVLVMLCRGEAGEFRRIKGREVCSVEAGKVRYGDVGHGRAGDARSGELWYCEARRGASSHGRRGVVR